MYPCLERGTGTGVSCQNGQCLKHWGAQGWVSGLRITPRSTVFSPCLSGTVSMVDPTSPSDGIALLLPTKLSQLSPFRGCRHTSPPPQKIKSPGGCNNFPDSRACKKAPPANTPRPTQGKSPTLSRWYSPPCSPSLVVQPTVFQFLPRPHACSALAELPRSTQVGLYNPLISQAPSACDKRGHNPPLQRFPPFPSAADGLLLLPPSQWSNLCQLLLPRKVDVTAPCLPPTTPLSARAPEAVAVPLGSPLNNTVLPPGPTACLPPTL